MDDRAHNSGHLMLITPERVFYAGLLGRPRERCPGAFHVYVAIKGGLWLTTADGRESYGELAAVPPNELHTIASDYRSAICLVIEPEGVPDGTFDELSKRLSGPERGFFASREGAHGCRHNFHHVGSCMLRPCHALQYVPPGGWRVLRSPPTVLSQPKISSTRFRLR